MIVKEKSLQQRYIWVNLLWNAGLDKCQNCCRSPDVWNHVYSGPPLLTSLLAQVDMTTGLGCVQLLRYCFLMESDLRRKSKDLRLINLGWLGTSEPFFTKEPQTGHTIARWGSINFLGGYHSTLQTTIQVWLNVGSASLTQHSTRPGLTSPVFSGFYQCIWVRNYAYLDV